MARPSASSAEGQAPAQGSVSPRAVQAVIHDQIANLAFVFARLIDAVMDPTDKRSLEFFSGLLCELSRLSREARHTPGTTLAYGLLSAPLGPGLEVYLIPLPGSPPPDGLVRVPFHGDEIEVLKRGEDHWLPLRPLCERFGVDVEGQRKKLKAAPWATTEMISVVAEDGKTREVACLNLRSLAGWLFSIRASKVKPEVREALVRYQREAADALYRHFAQTSTPPPALPSGP